jgi:hypothetical protein
MSIQEEKKPNSAGSTGGKINNKDEKTDSDVETVHAERIATMIFSISSLYTYRGCVSSFT